MTVSATNKKVKFPGVLLVTAALFLAGVASAQEKYPVKWEYNNTSFAEFANTAEKELKVRFFYLDEWVSDLRLERYEGVNDLENILRKLFEGKSLYFFIDKAGDVVITKDFAVRFTEEESSPEASYIAPREYTEESENRRDETTYIEVGNPADRNIAGDVVVSGYITSRENKEPIAGVTVLVQDMKTGTISNSYGYYSVTLPRGMHPLQFTFIGLKTRKINLNLYDGGELNIQMSSVLIPLRETVVSAQKSVTLQRLEVGVEKVNISSFRLLPTSLGESDIIKSLLLIPGVQSVGEGSAGFNVRGGSADENLILLYGAPVYNSSHFFGFFSAVNPDIIKDATLYKGGIPGRYGGRISSVLDIASKDGNRNKLDGNAGISPVTTHLMVEGPIKKDTCYYVLSGRTTYSNWLFGLFDNPQLKHSRASFYDLNGRVVYELDSKNKFDLSGYYSHDSFRFMSDTVYSYTNNIFAAGWHHFFTRTFIANFSINNSFYQYGVSSIIPPTEGYVLSHSINSTGMKADFNLFKGRQEINFGIDATRYEVLPGSYIPRGDSSLVIREVINRERAMEAALYFDNKLNLTDNITLEAGLRFSSYFVLGPRTVYVYDPDLPRSTFAISDTLTYKSGLPYKIYGGPEIRLSANFRMTDNSSFKVNYNRTKQYVHLLSNTISISPTDVWKLSDSYIKPETGDQFAFGYYRMFSNNSIETSAEVYYKTISGIVDFKGGSKIIMNENIERDLVNADGRAYGLELMVKRNKGRVRGSLSYTFSRTLHRSIGKFSDEIINGGKWYPANFDRPHDLIASVNYLISRRFSISADYTYTSGRPVTFPVASYYFDKMMVVYYSDRNKYRLPYYSRLDASFKLSGNLKARKIANPNWIFSVYNLLGRENVYSVYFKNENNTVNGYKLSVFGRAIPTVTFNFDF